MRLVTRFEGRWRGGPGAGTPCIGPRAAGPHSCLPLSWRRVLQGDFGSFPRRAACCRGCGVGYRALPSRTNLPGSWRREGSQAGPGSSTSGIRGLGATWWVLGHFGHVCEELGPPRDEWGQHSIPVLRRAPQGPQGRQERQGPRLPLQLCRAIPAEATPRGLQDAPGPAP